MRLYLVTILMTAILVNTGPEGLAQEGIPCRHFDRDSISQADSIWLMQQYGKNKILIHGYELQTLLALSYFPELKESKIHFELKATRSPLNTRPIFPQVMNKGSKRSYLITISDSSIAKLEPILLKKMDFNAQIGVIGHELSHAADFTHRNFPSLVGSGIGHVSSSYIDHFEYRTDSICIAHGLGYQLLAWSRFVRKTLHSENYDGSDNIDKPIMDHERYMNPSTIEKRMAAIPLYAKSDTCCCIRHSENAGNQHVQFFLFPAWL